ncbi:hypothetical protein B0T13DRAFT_33843 [Neurospora crassa]|nr:hypothetical protein B0T13DRAFT_33843 [Neurospora crassa]
MTIMCELKITEHCGRISLFQCFEIHTSTLRYKGNRCPSPEFPRRPGNDEHHKPEFSRTECLGHKHPLSHVAVIHMIVHKVQPSYDGGQFSVLQQAQICGCRSLTGQTRFPLSGCLTYLTSFLACQWGAQESLRIGVLARLRQPVSSPAPTLMATLALTGCDTSSTECRHLLAFRHGITAQRMPAVAGWSKGLYILSKHKISTAMAITGGRRRA